METIQDQQIEIAFANFAREKLQHLSRDVAARRRALLLALAERWPEFVPRSEAGFLTPRLAKPYAGRTEKTLTRDLNALERDGLIVRERKAGLRANLDALRAFLPTRFSSRRA